MKEELANLVRTFEALGPIVGNAVKNGVRGRYFFRASNGAGPLAS